MYETSVSGILFAGLWFISLMLYSWHYRQQMKIQLALKHTVLMLEEDIAAQKHLIQMQMQDLTTQMSSHAALHEKLQETEKKLLELELWRAKKMHHI